jgi:hypothetical protein
VLIHVDKKFPEVEWRGSELERIIENCGGCGTREMHSVADCKWGGWSMNEPVIWALDFLTFTYRGVFDKFITLSGDSLPTLTNEAMSSVVDQCLAGNNVVTSVWSETGFLPTRSTYFPEGWHKRTAYSHPIKLDYVQGGVNVSKDVHVYFGSQWMMLEPDFVYYIGESMRDSESLANSLKRAYLRDRRVVTDETFFPTLLMESGRFNSTLPGGGEGGIDVPGCEWIKTVRYERMDEHTPSAFGDLPNKQRYKAVEGTESKVWGPYFLGIYDLKDIKDSGALFIRKVSKEVEPNIYLMFPQENRAATEALPDIDWGSDGLNYEITKRPDFQWFNKQKELHARQKRESKKLGGGVGGGGEL